MGKRPASSRATRGASKGRKPPSSSSSNPKTHKFRSQYNSLATIAKGGPSKKTQNKESIKKLAKDAIERKKLLDGIESMDVLGETKEKVQNDQALGSDRQKKRSKKLNQDNISITSGGSKLTTASFASVWSNCTNASLNEFFQVWNPNLETHKDALAVIAGLSQVMSSTQTDQSDLQYATTLFKILSSAETPLNVLTGALLALTFVMRKLPTDVIVENFDTFYPILKNLLETHYSSKKKTLVKSLIRCFVRLSKSHPLGKDIIEKPLRKKINLAIRQYKIQHKIRL